MRSSIKRLFSRWHLDNVKVVRRVIVSVVGATVLLIGIALLGSEKSVDLRVTLSPVETERQFPTWSHRVIAASTRNAQPNAPKTRLTNQNERFFVSAEIAAMAIAIWNIVTPRANTSCL